MTLAAAQAALFVWPPPGRAYPRRGGGPALARRAFARGFALTALGFVIAWPLESTQGFHVMMNLVLIPLWLLSGHFSGPGRPLDGVGGRAESAGLHHGERAAGLLR